MKKNSDISLPPVPDENECNDVYATACAVMMYANGLARRYSMKEYAAVGKFFRVLSANYVCGQPVRARSMSPYSKAVYFQERRKDDQYTQQRKENFEYLFHRLATFSTIHLVSSDFSRFTSAPFCFHIYAEDRLALSRYLKSKGILAWVHIPRPTCFKTLDEQTEYMFKHILSFPCDQRYTQNDMKLLCDALEVYEREQRSKGNAPQII